MSAKKSLLTIAFSFIIGISMAQIGDYKTAVGLRSYPFVSAAGITFKQFIAEDKALEVVGYFWNGARITGLYEIHKPLLIDRLNWYYGGGAHVSMYNAKNYSGGTFLGVDGVVGLDYKIANTPINISLDWQPSVEFGSGLGFSSGWGGLSVRYVLK
jgi:hypothetical protein